MPKLTNVAVSLKLPFLGDINGTWEPDEAEQRAAWEMYVELVARVSLVELQPGEGLLHEALASLYTLFDSTRKILRECGPGVARPKGEGRAFVWLLGDSYHQLCDPPAAHEVAPQALTLSEYADRFRFFSPV